MSTNSIFSDDTRVYKAADATVAIPIKGVYGNATTWWQINKDKGICFACMAYADINSMSLVYVLRLVIDDQMQVSIDLPQSIFEQYRQECFLLLSIIEKAAKENGIYAPLISFRSMDEWMQANAYEEWVAHTTSNPKGPQLKLTYISQGSGSVNDFGVTNTELQVKKPLSSSNPDCFIATAAYGSPDLMEVQRFRLFRDQYLIQCGPGRYFIKLYYKVSPLLASWISSSEFLRRITRIALDACAIFLPV